MFETEALCTRLGKELLALENNGASDHDVARLQEQLQAAFNQLRQLRRCYAKQTSQGGIQ